MRLLARRPTRSRPPARQPRRRGSRSARSGRRVTPPLPESHGVAQPERDRHLAEDVTRESLADHALQAVDEHDRLDPSREHAEQRPLVAFVHGKLTGAERDIGRHTAEPLAVDRMRSANSSNRLISSEVSMQTPGRAVGRRRARGAHRRRSVLSAHPRRPVAKGTTILHRLIAVDHTTAGIAYLPASTDMGRTAGASSLLT